jgi:hypothetical protein
MLKYVRSFLATSIAKVMGNIEMLRVRGPALKSK